MLRPGVHSRWCHPCPANLVTITAQKFLHLPFSKEVSQEPFTRAPCLFFELCPFFVAGVAFRDILKSETPSSVTGAGHRTRFHPRGRHGAFCMLLKRWQAWVKMRGAFEGNFSWQAQCLVNLDDIVKLSKSHFVKLSTNMMIPCGKRSTSDALRSFFVAGAVVCRPRPKKWLTQVKRRFSPTA